MRLTLEKTSARVNSLNVRSEKHQQEEVPACDLGVTFKAANSILNVFHPSLLAALYHSTAAAEGQKLVEGVEHTLPNLRIPNIAAPIRLSDEGAGYTLTIDYGLGGKRSNMVLTGCAINKLAISPQEGGTVEVSFRVQLLKPSAETIGNLGLQVQHNIVIDLVPPEVKDLELDNVTPITRTKKKKLTADEAQAMIQDALAVEGAELPF